jgi:hypothetical protein
MNGVIAILFKAILNGSSWSDSEATAAHPDGRNQGVRQHGCRRSEPVTPGSVSRQRLDQPRLGGGQQLRKRREVVTASSREHECRIHVDPNHVTTRREPQLALAGEQHVQASCSSMLIKACSRYRSLSAVARAITGTQWSGPLFFGLRKTGRGT